MEANLLPSAPKYKNARVSLLIVLICSLINVFALFAGYYFYFSSRIALVLVAIGMQVDVTAGTTFFKFVFAALAVASLVPYLLSWIFSKKRVGWMIAALALFSVDTLVLLIDVPSVIKGGDYTIIIDIVVHAIILFELAIGVKAGFSMKKEAEDAAAQEQKAQAENDETVSENDGTISENDESKTRSAVITREKSFLGVAVPFIVYVNGREICRLKNGESQTVNVPSSSFELSVALNNGFANAKKTVEAGEEEISFALKTKMGFSSSSIQITQK